MRASSTALMSNPTIENDHSERSRDRKSPSGHRFHYQATEKPFIAVLKELVLLFWLFRETIMAEQAACR